MIQFYILILLQSLLFQPIGREFVHKQLSAMQKGKASGLDNLYTWLLKDTSNIIMCLCFIVEIS